MLSLFSSDQFSSYLGTSESQLLEINGKRKICYTAERNFKKLFSVDFQESHRINHSLVPYLWPTIRNSYESEREKLSLTINIIQSDLIWFHYAVPETRDSHHWFFPYIFTLSTVTLHGIRLYIYLIIYYLSFSPYYKLQEPGGFSLYPWLVEKGWAQRRCLKMLLLLNEYVKVLSVDWHFKIWSSYLFTTANAYFFWISHLQRLPFFPWMPNIG